MASLRRTVAFLWKGEFDLTDIGEGSALVGPGVPDRLNSFGELIRALEIRPDNEEKGWSS